MKQSSCQQICCKIIAFPARVLKFIVDELVELFWDPPLDDDAEDIEIVVKDE